MKTKVGGLVGGLIGGYLCSGTRRVERGGEGEVG